MVYWHEGILLYIATVLVHSHGVDPACECVVYQSYGLSQGVFKSPNHPSYYKKGINCILFTFVGDVGEIVEINFMDLDLKAPVKISETQYQCTDRIRIFQNLDRPEVNEDSRWDEEICGNISDLEEKKFYSKDRGLILEFHTEHSRESHKGFKGVFTFLEKSTFKTDGILRTGTQCTYYFQSYNNQTKGNFYSPRYPQKYLKDLNCQYIFLGHPHEIVRVKFKNIQLHYSGTSCVDSQDKIIVHDGKNSSSRIIKTYCDTHNREIVNSSGPYMYIELLSDRHHEKQGFAAEYHFVDKNSGTYRNDNYGGTSSSDSGQSFDCNKSISSRVKKNGTIHSPKHPNPYPSSITCQYEFEGVRQERVQLRFVDMNLYYTGRDPADPFDCSSQDHISVVVYIDGKEEVLDTYCGQKTPPQLMSNGVRMKVIFRSESSQKINVSGFKLEYSFRTDFGVQGTGEQDSRGVCKFKYDSRKAKSGVFTSPNFPGKYPNSCECNYIFKGETGEKVNVTFETVDLNWIGCDDSTKSDFVSFSNYLNAEDRKMPRYCGKKQGEPTEQSDGAFFRVTFRSNHIYDAQGFKAVYAFHKERKYNEDVTPGPVVDNPHNQGSRSSSCVTLTVIILMCLRLTVIFPLL